MRWNLKEAGYGEHTNPWANLWSDEQKPHIPPFNLYYNNPINFYQRFVLFKSVSNYPSATSSKYILSCEILMIVPLNSDSAVLITGAESGEKFLVGSSRTRTFAFCNTIPK